MNESLPTVELPFPAACYDCGLRADVFVNSEDDPLFWPSCNICSQEYSYVPKFNIKVVIREVPH